MSSQTPPAHAAHLLQDLPPIKSPTTSTSDGSPREVEALRGRRQSRRSTTIGNTDGASGGETTGGPDSPVDGRRRKRKRSRKGLDKKFECEHEGCGKSYSRAEHLYRHFLNHDPKKIYECDFPDCPRTFVRQDLCARHRERHTARGSHLQRNHSFIHHIDAAPPRSVSAAGPPHAVLGPALAQNPPVTSAPYVPPLIIPPHLPGRSPMSAPPIEVSSQPRANTSTPPGIHFTSPRTYSTSGSMGYNQSYNHLNRSNSDGQFANVRSYNPATTAGNVPLTNHNHQRHSSFGSVGSAGFSKPPGMDNQTPHSNGQSVTSPSQYRGNQIPQYDHVSSNTYSNQLQMSNTEDSGCFTPHQQLSTLSALPPPYLNLTPQSMQNGPESYKTPQTRVRSVDSNADMDMSGTNISDSTLMDSGSAACSVTVFGAEGYNRSPLLMSDNMFAWLFNEQADTPALLDQQQGFGSIDNMKIINHQAEGSNSLYDAGDQMPNGQHPNPIPQQHPMSVTSILDPGLPQMILSEEKKQQILDIIISRFNETNYSPVRKQKEALLDGDCEQENHVLSRQMLQTYIGSYWYHFHPQMPILHKSTFSAENAQSLLLIAVIAIGASCLDKMHGPKITKAGAELSSFLAWHLRGEIFIHADFRPPAKLWVFQTLLLLEIYEKMYSTRILHERAHIHHATTLTLMRRGSSLLGRSALDSPPTGKEDKTDHTINGAHLASIAHTPSQWWNHWITSEATRRVAFAAFIVDALHATMFGHGAILIANEMRLHLPCDEALWSATSEQEIGRMDTALRNEGASPILFLEGLKRTLNGETVRTNSFGRTGLMAGLLSVSLNMHQRDQQVHSLGAWRALGGKDIWRGTLTRAFDFWKRDFDQSTVNDKHSSVISSNYHFPSKLDEENIFESRTVLHHLAHMAQHVDIVHCQIFARATRLLGRTISPTDYSSAQKRMKERWAPSVAARDAVFYALQFLSQVLLPNASPSSTSTNTKRSGHSTPDMAPGVAYSARDDFLLNRPWVLYFAALVVWSYGYALDGPVKSLPPLHTLEQQSRDMSRFLHRVGGVRSPDDLATMKDRNACVGMLILLRDEFKTCRWELLHEAWRLLDNCIEMSTGSSGFR